MSRHELEAVAEALHGQVETVVVGGGPLARQLLLGVLAGGHVLLEGIPGVAKTLLARTFARLLGLPFRRLQLTPDLLPADITGTMVLGTPGGPPVFRPGPLFTGVLLADEVNRAPPRTQAALLEAMEERQVTVDGTSHPLAAAFTVVATLNSVETEGAWPLPLAQLDRFLLRVVMGYPDPAAEEQLLARVAEGRDPRREALESLQPLLDEAGLDALRRRRRTVRISPPVRSFLLALVHGLRNDPRMAVGPSPRAAVQLAEAAQARAALAGRDHVVPDDVAVLLAPVLGHRLRLHPELALDREHLDSVLAEVRQAVEVPR